MSPVVGDVLTVSVLLTPDGREAEVEVDGRVMLVGLTQRQALHAHLTASGLLDRPSHVRLIEELLRGGALRDAAPQDGPPEQGLPTRWTFLDDDRRFTTTTVWLLPSDDGRLRPAAPPGPWTEGRRLATAVAVSAIVGAFLGVSPEWWALVEGGLQDLTAPWVRVHPAPARVAVLTAPGAPAGQANDRREIADLLAACARHAPDAIALDIPWDRDAPGMAELRQTVSRLRASGQPVLTGWADTPSPGADASLLEVASPFRERMSSASRLELTTVDDDGQCWPVLGLTAAWAARPDAVLTAGARPSRTRWAPWVGWRLTAADLAGDLPVGPDPDEVCPGRQVVVLGFAEWQVPGLTLTDTTPVVVLGGPGAGRHDLPGPLSHALVARELLSPTAPQEWDVRLRAALAPTVASPCGASSGRPLALVEVGPGWASFTHASLLALVTAAVGATGRRHRLGPILTAAGCLLLAGGSWLVWQTWLPMGMLLVACGLGLALQAIRVARSRRSP